MRVERAVGVATACRCNADAEAVPGTGLRTSLVKGAELERDVGAGDTFELFWISPVAAETLLVNEEIAQPVQDAASLG